MPRLLARRLAAVLALALAATVLLAGPANAASTGGIRVEEQRITVAGGPGVAGPVELDTTVYLPATTPAPAVLVAHGFGGSKASVDADARDLAARGFVALAWSARGFGTSTGQIALDSPDYEVADARALVDWLAARPEVVQDGPDDPRVGITGGSYGGAISLLLAGYDRRVDALAPVITWNDLGQALFPDAAAGAAPPLDTPARGAFGPDGVFKRGWAGVFFSAGLSPGAAGSAPGSTGTAPDSPSTAPDSPGTAPDSPSTGADPVGPEPDPTAPITCGRFTAQVCAAYTEAATTGRLSPATADLLRRSSPATVTDRITAPTLLVQGEQDTLFGLDQSDANARQIAAAGGPVKVLWYAGGHDGAAPGPAVREAIGGWFSFHLAGVGDDPGTGFGYAVDSGVRTSGSTATSRMVVAPDYPGLPGSSRLQTVQLGLVGAPQVILTPAGGSPAAITSLPGLSGALGTLGSRLSALTAQLPGQSAQFRTDALDSPLLLAGAPRVEVSVSRPGPPAAEADIGPPAAEADIGPPAAEADIGPPAAEADIGPPAAEADIGPPAAGEAVLFATTSEVSPDGLRTLLGSAVAPFRVAVPADGSPATVSVTLPGVVAPIEAGNRLMISVGTTDQGYAGSTDPAVWQIAAAGGLTVPVVPGTAVTANTVPLVPAIGIAVVLGLVAAGALVARLIRRRGAATAAGPDPAVLDPAVLDPAVLDPAVLDPAVLDPAGPPLEIRDLAKTYRGGFSAVTGVSFTVRRGMVLGLLGPNGAGKTTVLRMLMGLIRPTAGSITAFGLPVGAGAPVLARIGAFVEGPGFLPHLSGADNLRLYWAATGRPTTEARLEEALEIAGLGASIERRVGTYSHGMRQRLAIAQAMLGLPELLVLDEPTNGLDPPQIHAMREVLRRYAAGGRTVLVSSHLLAEVEQTCDHVVVMHHGKVVADGTVDDIIAGGGAATFSVDAPAPAAAVLGGLAGVHAVEIDGRSVHAELNGTPRAFAVRALVTAGVDVASAGPRRRLEDAFLQLVGEDREP